MAETKDGSALLTVSLKAILKDDDGRILMLEKTGKGHWDLPGGKLDHDEGMSEGLLREVYEETGLDGLEINQIIYAGRRSFEDKEKPDRILIFYCCQLKKPIKNLSLSDEHCDWRMMKPKDINDPKAYEINPIVREALHRAFLA